MSTLVAVTRITLAKDMRLEWRSKDALNAMLFFGLLVVVIFSFAFDPTAEESRHIAGGLIWVAFLFAAVVALNQTWARELRNQVLDAYGCRLLRRMRFFSPRRLATSCLSACWRP